MLEIRIQDLSNNDILRVPKKNSGSNVIVVQSRDEESNNYRPTHPCYPNSF